MLKAPVNANSESIGRKTAFEEHRFAPAGKVTFIILRNLSEDLKGGNFIDDVKFLRT